MIQTILASAITSILVFWGMGYSPINQLQPVLPKTQQLGAFMPISIMAGGTGTSSLSRNAVILGNATSSLFASSSPSFGALYSTTTATSTLYAGLNVETGCLAVAGTCLTTGSGITSLNGLTGASQTFSAQGPLLIGSSGTAHTFIASSSPSFGELRASTTLAVATTTLGSFTFGVHGSSLLAGSTTVMGLLATSSIETPQLRVFGTATTTFGGGILVTGNVCNTSGSCLDSIPTSSGITSLNGLSGATQTFAAQGPLLIGSSGTVHTFIASSSPSFGELRASTTLAVATTTLNSIFTLGIQGNSLFSGDVSLANLKSTGTITFIGTSMQPLAALASSSLIHASTTQGITSIEEDNECAINHVLASDLYSPVFNNSGATIGSFKSVYITGGTQTLPNIALAQANSTSTLPAIGITEGSILNGKTGCILKLGTLLDVNTSAFAVNDTIYVSPTVAGGLIKNRPTYPNFVQRIGSVIKSDATSGTFYVTVAPFLGGNESGTKLNSFSIGNDGLSTTTIYNNATSTFGNGITATSLGIGSGGISMTGGSLLITSTATSTWSGGHILTGLTSTGHGLFSGWGGFGTTTFGAQFSIQGGTSNNLFMISSSTAGVTLKIDNKGFLGLGGTSTPQANLSVVGSAYVQEYTNPYSATLDIDWSKANQQRVTLTGNTTVTFRNGWDGGSYRLVACQDSTGSRIITWPATSTLSWVGYSAPGIATTQGGRCDIFSFIVTAATSSMKYVGLGSLNF